MTEWLKPQHGTVIEINDEPATIEYAESLGWIRCEEEEVEENIDELDEDETEDE